MVNNNLKFQPRKINIYEQKKGDISQLFDEKSDNLVRKLLSTQQLNYKSCQVVKEIIVT